MSNPDQQRVEALFLAATVLAEPDREVYLRRECGEDAALRARVDSLLAAADSSEQFFEGFAGRIGSAALFGDRAAARAADDAAPGERVGPYTLTALIARGGMGSVWRAARADGRFEGQVAIKFVHLQGGAPALRRFELEGGFLARLTHPHIARLLDAGVSEGGRPYLVLEFVDGAPIDAYAERERLSIAARIELFLDVLSAVQHAHAHLVVHRDIKPTNVLVTSAGDVKLLDFGVAKLVDAEELAAEPGVTRELGLALTPEYAAPEQFLGQPITTATDVYSLGLLLYRLLSGRHAREVVGTGSQALLKLATGPDPGKPSEAVAATLRKALRGDLDNIVAKATAREPARRYAGVADLAADLRRYLDHEPVSAQPPTVSYRVSKFVRRHRGGVTAAALMAVVLIGSSAVTAWQARAAALDERRANSVKDFVASLFRGVDPNALGVARPRTAVEILQQAARRVDGELAGQPQIQDELRTIIARSYLGLYEAQLAEDAARHALEVFDPASSPALRRELDFVRVEALVQLSRLDEAGQHLETVMAQLDSAAPDADLVRARVAASAIEYQRGKYDDAAARAEEALVAANDARISDPVLLAQVHTTYAKAVELQRKIDVSLHHNGEALRLALDAYAGDHDHPQVLEMEHNYAASLISVGRIADAIPHLERSLQAARATYGDSSLIASRYAVRYGLAQMERGALRPALDLIGTGTRIEHDLDVGISPATSGRLRTLGRAHLAAREPAEARVAFEAAIDVMRRFDAPFMMRVLEADRAFAAASMQGNLRAGVAELDGVRVAQDGGDPRYKSHLPDLYAATLLVWNAEPQAATPYLQRGLELARAQTRKTDLAEGLITQGDVFLAAGDVAGAAGAFGEARDLLEQNQVVATPALAEARVGLGRVALRRGEIAGALEHFEMAGTFWAEFAPDSRGAGDAWYWKSRALEAAGRRDDARAALEQARHRLASSRLPVDVMRTRHTTAANAL